MSDCNLFNSNQVSFAIEANCVYHPDYRELRVRKHWNIFTCNNWVLLYEISDVIYKIIPSKICMAVYFDYKDFLHRENSWWGKKKNIRGSLILPVHRQTNYSGCKQSLRRVFCTVNRIYALSVTTASYLSLQLLTQNKQQWNIDNTEDFVCCKQIISLLVLPMVEVAMLLSTLYLQKEIRVLLSIQSTDIFVCSCFVKISYCNPVSNKKRQTIYW